MFDTLFSPGKRAENNFLLFSFFRRLINRIVISNELIQYDPGCLIRILNNQEKTIIYPLNNLKFKGSCELDYPIWDVKYRVLNSSDVLFFIKGINICNGFVAHFLFEGNIWCSSLYPGIKEFSKLYKKVYIENEI